MTFFWLLSTVHHFLTLMPVPSRQELLEKTRTRSYNNLHEARKLAVSKSGYDYAQTRREIGELFVQRFARAPYEWQLDVAEAILLGVDTVLIAGTGAGKTMPFMMPLLLKKNKLEIIISPLKVLQKDQVSTAEVSQASQIF